MTLVAPQSPSKPPAETSPFMPLSAYERALRAKLINIASAKYAQKDCETELDVSMLYAKAGEVIVRRSNPRVLVVMPSRFLAAALAVMLQRFGCRVVICDNGKDAYTKYLKRFSSEFDLVIVQWGMDGVGAQDLIFYEREKGSRVAFLAALPSGASAEDAIRSGADLFLRMPLWIHLHTLRELLLPSVESSYDYPTDVMQLQSQHESLKRILDQVTSAADAEADMLIDEAKFNSADTENMDFGHGSELLERLIQRLRLHPSFGGGGTAVDSQEHRRLLKAFEASLRTFNSMKDEMVRLTGANQQLRAERSQLVDKTPISETSFDPNDDIDTADMTTKQFDLYLKLFRRHIQNLECENDSLVAELERLLFFKVQLEENVASNNIAVVFNDATVTVDPEQAKRHFRRRSSRPPSVSVATPEASVPPASPESAKAQPDRWKRTMSKLAELSISALRRRTEAKPFRAHSMEEVCQNLECMLMAREDPRLRPHVEPVPITPVTVQYPLVEDPVTPIAHLYNACILFIQHLCSECNVAIARVMAGFPAAQPKLEDFARKLVAAISDADLSNRFDDAQEAVDAERIKAVAALTKEVRQLREAKDVQEAKKSTVALRVEMAKFRQRCALALKLHARREITFRAFRAWQLWACEKRLTVSAEAVRKQIHHEVFETKHTVTEEMRSRMIHLETQLNEKTHLYETTSKQCEQLSVTLEKLKLLNSSLKRSLVDSEKDIDVLKTALSSVRGRLKSKAAIAAAPPEVHVEDATPSQHSIAPSTTASDLPSDKGPCDDQQSVSTDLSLTPSSHKARKTSTVRKKRRTRSDFGVRRSSSPRNVSAAHEVTPSSKNDSTKPRRRRTEVEVVKSESLDTSDRRTSLHSARRSYTGARSPSVDKGSAPSSAVNNNNMVDPSAQKHSSATPAQATPPLPSTQKSLTEKQETSTTESSARVLDTRAATVEASAQPLPVQPTKAPASTPNSSMQAAQQKSSASTSPAPSAHQPAAQSNHVVVDDSAPPPQCQRTVEVKPAASVVAEHQADRDTIKPATAVVEQQADRDTTEPMAEARPQKQRAYSLTSTRTTDTDEGRTNEEDDVDDDEDQEEDDAIHRAMEEIGAHRSQRLAQANDPLVAAVAEEHGFQTDQTERATQWVQTDCIVSCEAETGTLERSPSEWHFASPSTLGIETGSLIPDAKPQLRCNLPLESPKNAVDNAASRRSSCSSYTVVPLAPAMPCVSPKSPFLRRTPSRGPMGPKPSHFDGATDKATGTPLQTNAAGSQCCISSHENAAQTLAPVEGDEVPLKPEAPECRENATQTGTFMEEGEARAEAVERHENATLSKGDETALALECRAGCPVPPAVEAKRPKSQNESVNADAVFADSSFSRTEEYKQPTAAMRDTPEQFTPVKAAPLSRLSKKADVIVAVPHSEVPPFADGVPQPQSRQSDMGLNLPSIPHRQPPVKEALADQQRPLAQQVVPLPPITSVSAAPPKRRVPHYMMQLEQRQKEKALNPLYLLDETARQCGAPAPPPRDEPAAAIVEHFSSSVEAQEVMQSLRQSTAQLEEALGVPIPLRRIEKAENPPLRDVIRELTTMLAQAAVKISAKFIPTTTLPNSTQQNHQMLQAKANNVTSCKSPHVVPLSPRQLFLFPLDGLASPNTSPRIARTHEGPQTAREKVSSTARVGGPAFRQWHRYEKLPAASYFKSSLRK